MGWDLQLCFDHLSMEFESKNVQYCYWSLHFGSSSQPKVALRELDLVQKSKLEIEYRNRLDEAA